MTTASLQGLKKVKMTKKDFKSYLANFKMVKNYNDFGNEEYIVYTSGFKTIGAIDINTNEIYITT